MSIRSSAQEASQPAAVSRIGERRQVVIPKRVFEALRLQEGDFVKVRAGRGRLEMCPRRLLDVDDVLSKTEAAKVRRGEAQLKRGQARPWRAVKYDLGR